MTLLLAELGTKGTEPVGVDKGKRNVVEVIELVAAVMFFAIQGLLGVDHVGLVGDI